MRDDWSKIIATDLLLLVVVVAADKQLLFVAIVVGEGEGKIRGREIEEAE